jgi:hypothetical protein
MIPLWALNPGEKKNPKTGEILIYLFAGVHIAAIITAVTVAVKRRRIKA